MDEGVRRALVTSSERIGRSERRKSERVKERPQRRKRNDYLRRSKTQTAFVKRMSTPRAEGKNDLRRSRSNYFDVVELEEKVSMPCEHLVHLVVRQ